MSISKKTKVRRLKSKKTRNIDSLVVSEIGFIMLPECKQKDLFGDFYTMEHGENTDKKVNNYEMKPKERYIIGYTKSITNKWEKMD